MPYKSADDRRQYQRAYQQQRRAERRAGLDGAPGGNPEPAPAPVAFRTAHDALAILSEQLAAVRADARAGPQNRARTVAYLVSVGLRAVEVADVAERLAAIEERLNGAGIDMAAVGGSGTGRQPVLAIG